MSEGIIKTAIICLTIVMVFYIMSKMYISEFESEITKNNDIKDAMKMSFRDGYEMAKAKYENKEDNNESDSQ